MWIGVKDSSIPQKARNIITRCSEGQLLIILSDNFNDTKERLHILNNTATFIWRKIDNKRTVKNIVKLARDNFYDNKSLIGKDVKDILNKFIKWNLIKVSSKG